MLRTRGVLLAVAIGDRPPERVDSNLFLRQDAVHDLVGRELVAHHAEGELHEGVTEEPTVNITDGDLPVLPVTL